MCIDSCQEDPQKSKNKETLVERTKEEGARGGGVRLYRFLWATEGTLTLTEFNYKGTWRFLKRGAA